jgi:hypothetical protein
MGKLEIVYRLEIKVPRSEESAENSTMEPASGAPHSDKFLVASKTGILKSGNACQPYLGQLRGARGSINWLKRSAQIGEITVELVDKRLADTDNLERWFSAFIGNDAGHDRMRGAKVIIEESTDGGTTFGDFYAGRLRAYESNGRTKVRLRVREGSEDMRSEIFVGRPHTSATGAIVSNLCPIGLGASYGPLAARQPLNAEYLSAVYGGSARRRKITIDSAARDWAPNMVFNALSGMTERTKLYHVVQAEASSDITEQLRVVYDDGTNSGEFVLVMFRIKRRKEKNAITELIIEELDSGDPNYVAFPGTDQSSATVSIIWTGTPTEKTPLYIDDIHPAQLFKDILDGYYGPLDSDGSVLTTISYNSAAFTSLIADLTFKTGRFEITAAAKMFDWLEKHLCVAYGLAYRFNKAGELVPLDARWPTTLPSATTITNADLAENAPAPRWKLDDDAAVPVVELIHHAETGLNVSSISENDESAPDYPTSGIRSREHVARLIERDALLDIGDKKLIIKGIGYRTFTGESLFNQGGAISRRRELELRGKEFLYMFARGTYKTELICARTANVSGVLQGDFIVLDVDELVDHATWKRGGVRLTRCTHRIEDGGKIRFRFIDVGLNATCVVPSISSIAQDPNDQLHRVRVIVVLNGGSDAVQVDYAVTETSVGTRPVAGSNLWHWGTTAATGQLTVYVRNLPAGKRVWIRARSIPSSSRDLKSPSA